MNDDRVYDEKLYRVVRKKDSHLNTKINLDGSKAAIQFTDDSNNLSGPVDIVEVDESELKERYCYPVESSCQEVALTPEQQELAEIIGKAIAAGVTWLTIEVVIPGARKLWKERVSPAIARKWNSIKQNSNSPKVANYIKYASYEPRTEAISVQCGDTSGMVVHELNDAYSKYVYDITSEEAQRELLDIFILSVILATKVNKLKSYRVINGEASSDYIEGQQIINRLSTPEFINAINQLLRSNRVLLEEKASTLTDVLGCTVYKNGKLVPIDVIQLRENLWQEL